MSHCVFVFAQFALHTRQGFPFMAHLHALCWIKRREEVGRVCSPAGASLLLRCRRRESGGGASPPLGFALWWSVTAALVRSRFPPLVASPQPRHDAGRERHRSSLCAPATDACFTNSLNVMQEREGALL